MSYRTAISEATFASRASCANGEARAAQLRFGPFTFDVKAGELSSNGGRNILQSQPHTILVMLVEHPGEVVSREEIQERLWPDGVIVSYDVGISQAM